MSCVKFIFYIDAILITLKNLFLILRILLILIKFLQKLWANTLF